MSFTYTYPRPAVTTDVVLITKDTPAQILLIKRANDPFKDQWAFPGGFVDMDEDLPTAARRELNEETGISIPDVDIIQYKTYGAINRDPRHRTISVVFYTNLNKAIPAKGMDDAADAAWFSIKKLPQLAFDHQTIIDDIITSLQLN